MPLTQKGFIPEQMEKDNKRVNWVSRLTQMLLGRTYCHNDVCNDDMILIYNRVLVQLHHSSCIIVTCIMTNIINRNTVNCF